MRKLLLLLLLLLSANFSFAQKVKLKERPVNIEFVQLPTNPILDDKQRTYSSNTTRIDLEGFTKVKEGANIEIFFDYFGTRVANIKINKIPHEKKDKNGKVISKTFTYQIEGNISSSGKLTVRNHLTNNNYDRPYNIKSRYVSKIFNSYGKAKEFYDFNRENIIEEYKEKHISSMIRDANHYVDSTYGYNIFKGRFFMEVLKNKKHP
jgi:hypothetical protein